MTQETQAPVAGQQDQAQQTVQVGFEKALMTMNPKWRTEFTPELVNLFRHYYHQGIQDMNTLANLNHQNAQQNFQAVLNTVVVTGNEERIAEMQRQQVEASSPKAKPTKTRTKAKAKPKASVPLAGVVAAAAGSKAVSKVAAKPVKAPAKAVKAVKSKR